MRMNRLHTCATAFLTLLPLVSLQAESADANEARIARLEARLVELEARLATAEEHSGPASTVSEARILELESRLAEAEQETKEVKVLAANAGSDSTHNSILGNTAAFDILAGSAWRNLRWTNEQQWAEVRPGASIETVIEALGPPPRSVESLKPRVDEVFYYETSIRDDGNALRGKVSFRKGKVLTVHKPNFKANKAAQ